jgi:hypothetical protein
LLTARNGCPVAISVYEGNTRPHFKFFFPLTTMLIVSLVLSVLAWIFRR